MSNSLTGSDHLVDYNEPLQYNTFYDGSELVDHLHHQEGSQKLTAQVFADGLRMPVPCGMTVWTDGSTQFLVSVPNIA